MAGSSFHEMFHYEGGHMHCEGFSLRDLAERFGTPLYVYSRQALTARFESLRSGFGDLPCLLAYSVKANSTLGILNVFDKLGSWFDIVSVGELERVLRAGGAGEQVIFSGVGKQDFEIQRALEARIACFNVESEAELNTLGRIGREMGRRVPVALRVNPDVDPQTHPYISTGLQEHKFGIPIDRARALYQRAAGMPEIRIWGASCHIGSQITSLSPFLAALDRLKALLLDLRSEGIKVPRLDLGGGLGVRYRDEVPPSPAEFAQAIASSLAGFELQQLVIEPGRSVVAEAGLLLTSVILTKRNGSRRFAVVDAAMNDLLRPALYGAWQEIRSVNRKDTEEKVWDVVGPVCESADFLGKDRLLPDMHSGDLLAVMNSGAYGSVMSSNYNSRPRAAEVLVAGKEVHLLRRRETIADLLRGESIPD